MATYWRKVFARAWADTKQSFGWNQKTAATVLLALLGLAVVFFHFGFIAALVNVTGWFWTALPIVVAGFLLFVWNFFSAQASLYTELSKTSGEAIAALTAQVTTSGEEIAALTAQVTTSGEKIAALELALPKSEQPPPDFASWRQVDRLTLRDAAFLWCDLAPGHAMPSNVQYWHGALKSAITKGELDFEPQFYRGAILKRTALQAFARMRGHDPKFLRDA
jgi:hypothetical protein